MTNRLAADRLLVLALLLTFPLCAIDSESVAGLPQWSMEPCPACNGRKSLSLTPPNLGQFNGEIGVEPGKPFASHRFDVKHDRCPLCSGSGRHKRFSMQRQPQPENAAVAPCASCLATGVAPCKKCRSTGYAACTKCRNAKKPGWILSEERTAGRTSRHMRKIVTPCQECKGLGKVICPACEGLGGSVCKKCAGAGYVRRKERK